MNFDSGISEQLAVSAFNGVSMSPEKRGRNWITAVSDGLKQDYEALLRYAETPEKKAILDEEFERYRLGVRKRNMAYLASNSRCISSFITGPSNFPVRRAEKRNNWANNKLNELVEFETRAKSAILKKLRPELRPIMSGDADAVERLQEKISLAERCQDSMRRANAAIRKSEKEQMQFRIAAVMLEGFTESQARRLLEPDFMGRFGFASFQLTNNNANIRRMKERLAQISKAKEKTDQEAAGKFAKVQDSPADNRIRLFFPGKPNEEIRSRLKSCGFRWTPTLGAWQAYRNSRTLETALDVAGVMTYEEKLARRAGVEAV